MPAGDSSDWHIYAGLHLVGQTMHATRVVTCAYEAYALLIHGILNVFCDVFFVRFHITVMMKRQLII